MQNNISNMDILAKKLEILDWIMHTDDTSILKRIETIKLSSKEKTKSGKINAEDPIYGLFKGKIYISPDFDEPLEDFKEYM